MRNADQTPQTCRPYAVWRNDGTRRHIRGALDAGATRDEILMILKMASVMRG